MRHTTKGQTRPWEVATGYKHESPQWAQWEELPSTANVVARLIGGGMLVFIVLALIPLAVETVGSFLPHSQPRCAECVR